MNNLLASLKRMLGNKNTVTIIGVLVGIAVILIGYNYRVNNTNGGMMMKSCFLFGHRDAPPEILPGLEQAVETEIQKGTTIFYVGNHGNFDSFAAVALKRAKQRHEGVVVMLLLAHHPAERTTAVPEGFDGTYYPPLENVPHRFSLSRANQYMIKVSDSVICYAKYCGNARKLWELAMRQREVRSLRVQNLAVQKTD